MNSNNKQILGYMNFEDLASSLFGLKASVVTVIGAFFATITTVITEYVWDDARAIYVLFAFIIFDAISGILRSVRDGTFTLSRLPRIVVIFVLYTGMLAVSWNLAQVSPVYFWVPSVLYGGFIVTLAISVFENVYVLGYIPEYMYKTIMEKVGLVQSFMFGKKFQESKFKEAAKAAPFGVWHADKNSKLIFVNDRTCKVLGLTKDEALDSDNWYHAMDPHDVRRVADAWSEAVTAKKTFSAKFRIIRNDGTSIFVRSTAAPLFDNAGAISGFMGTIIEVDEREAQPEIIY